MARRFSAERLRQSSGCSLTAPIRRGVSKRRLLRRAAARLERLALAAEAADVVKAASFVDKFRSRLASWLVAGSLATGFGGKAFTGKPIRPSDLAGLRRATALFVPKPKVVPPSRMFAISGGM